MAAKNNIVKSIARASLFDDAKALIDATISFNQGDLLYLDTVNHLIKKPTLEANGGTFLGVAVESVVLGKPVKPYVTDVDASSAIVSVPGPVVGVEASLTAKTGDVFVPGCAVYLDPATGTDGVTVTGTKRIGYYNGVGLTAVAGQKVVIVLKLGADL